MFKFIKEAQADVERMKLERELEQKRGTPQYEAEQARLAATRAEEFKVELDAYNQRRPEDIKRALRRRISTGDVGMPFAVIDTVFSTVVTGQEKYEGIDVGTALERTKEGLWEQCRHLGGDAVLFANFRFERGSFSFTSGVLTTMSLLLAPLRMGFDPTVKQEKITVWAQGTAVKLFPQGTAMTPQLYENFDLRWLDMRLPERFQK